MKNNKSSTRGPKLEMSVLARARAQLLNKIYISAHLEKISRRLFYVYIEIGTIFELSRVDEWELSRMV